MCFVFFSFFVLVVVVVFFFIYKTRNMNRRASRILKTRNTRTNIEVAMVDLSHVKS